MTTSVDTIWLCEKGVCVCHHATCQSLATWRMQIRRDRVIYDAITQYSDVSGRLLVRFLTALDTWATFPLKRLSSNVFVVVLNPFIRSSTIYLCSCAHLAPETLCRLKRQFNCSLNKQGLQEQEWVISYKNPVVLFFWVFFKTWSNAVWRYIAPYSSTWCLWGKPTLEAYWCNS